MVESTSVSAEIRGQRAEKPMPRATTGYLVVDTESVPDGELLRRVKYGDNSLTPEEAVARAQGEARAQSNSGSDFIPVTFHRPVAVCVLRVADDYTFLRLTCLDTPQFRTEEMVRLFWQCVGCFPRAKLVTFNGRGFDLPLLELAAYDYGVSARDYYGNMRNRYQGNQVDLMEWITNYGAHRMNGGLDNLAKRLHGDNRKRLVDDLDGPPGKKGITGDQVLELYRAGRLQEINDYCMWDTLDTYFVFLRTRVVLGELTRDEVRLLVRKALEWLEARAHDVPALARYLSSWQPALPRLTLVAAESVEPAGEVGAAPSQPETPQPEAPVTVEP
jgi:predicted PolB exonuclease-like 3'-5' exonuclease